MEHIGISTQYQKHIAKYLFAQIEAGNCNAGEKRRLARTVVAEYVESNLQGEYQQALLFGKNIRRNLQNVYELLIVFTEIRKNTIDLTERDFDGLDASKLALLSPFISNSKYNSKLKAAVELAKRGTAKAIRELKKSGVEMD